eukprot:XP_010660150.1 PREDICTED: uncharacterized protein LOC104881477 [Vitis vinifera]
MQWSITCEEKKKDGLSTRDLALLNKALEVKRNASKRESLWKWVIAGKYEEVEGGYDLHHFIDGTHTPPPPIVTVTGVASPNLAYTTWKRQDRLIFSAFLGAISISLQPFIARTTTSLDVIKTRADELAILGKPIDNENLIDRVLEGLSDEYKSVIDAINARDTSISFAELHEKLLNKETSLQTTQPSPLSLP